MLKCFVVQGIYGKSVSRVQPIGFVDAPRPDVAGDQELFLLNACDTTGIIVSGQYGGSKKSLVDPHLHDLLPHLSFLRQFFFRYMVQRFNRFVLEACQELFTFKRQDVPMVVKFRPDLLEAWVGKIVP